MKVIFKRLLYIIPSVIFVLFITFALTRIIPGDPARMMAGEQAPEESLANIRIEMGLDKSIPAQFADYIKDIFSGDLGTAWHTGKSVTSEFAARIPASVELALMGIFIAVIVGVPLGVLAASYKDKLPDFICRIISLLGISLPVFWTGLMAIFLLYAKLGWISSPLGRIAANIYPPTRITGLYLLDSILTGDFVAFADSFRHLLLPAICMSFGSLSIISRITRTSMIEVMNQDFVRTLRAKGLTKTNILIKHGLPNIAISALTVIGTQLGSMIGNAVIIETIFSWPGIGSFVTESILITDYAPVQAFAIVSVVLYILINLTLDILYVAIDPRLRDYRGGKSL